MRLLSVVALLLGCSHLALPVAVTHAETVPEKVYMLPERSECESFSDLNLVCDIVAPIATIVGGYAAYQSGNGYAVDNRQWAIGGLAAAAFAMLAQSCEMYTRTLLIQHECFAPWRHEAVTP